MLKKCKSWARRLALVAGLLCATVTVCTCDDSDKVRVFDSSPLAPSYSKLTSNDYFDILGATIIDKGVNFAVYSKNATRIEVLIFDSENPDTDQPLIHIPMIKDENSNIWTLYVQGIGVGTHYGYIAFGPNWPYDPEFFSKRGATGFITDCDANGNRFNPNKLLIDPYTRRIHRDFDWGSGNPASGTARDVNDWKAAAKSVVIKSEYVWSDNEAKWRENRMKGDAFEGHAQNDMIYYEVHPKGFTAKAIDISNPGTWRGIGEKAQYLADLGITAVELMPVGEKPDDSTYWGYNTIAFFAPEQRFATSINQKRINGVHDEFKEMVDKLHQAGIEVILDVVYNHTGEGGFWRSRVQSRYQDYGKYSNFDDMTAATIYSWRGLDNAEYYHLIDNNQKYLDNPGVGNQTRTNNKPFRRFILDNLHFWVEEMHVDGFRFDLASILGYPDESAASADVNSWLPNVGNTVVQDIINDEVLQKRNIRLIAEAWNMGMYVNGLFPKATNKNNFAWSEWNGRFRDIIRKFVNDDNWKLGCVPTDDKNARLGYCAMDRSPTWQADVTMGNILTGSSAMYNEDNAYGYSDGRQPFNSVNFLTAHDGFTLYDLATYNENQNNCGKLNPICCDQAYNAFCDLTSGEENNVSRNWCREECWDGGCQICRDGICTDAPQCWDYKRNQQIPSWGVEGCDEAHCWAPGCNEGFTLGSDGQCNNSAKEALKRQIIRDFFAFMMISHGTPMILGGDEFMRTQFGNNNAYSDSADNEWNWFRWGDWLSASAPERQRMHHFVRDLIKIRKKFKAHLSPTVYSDQYFQWWNPQGKSSDEAWLGKSIAMYYPKRDETPELFVIINMETSDTNFPLPDGDWKVLADTQSYYDYDVFNNDPSLDKAATYNSNVDEGINTVRSTYGAKSRTIVILTKK